MPDNKIAASNCSRRSDPVESVVRRFISEQIAGVHVQECLRRTFVNFAQNVPQKCSLFVALNFALGKGNIVVALQRVCTGAR